MSKSDDFRGHRSDRRGPTSGAVASMAALIAGAGIGLTFRIVTFPLGICSSQCANLSKFHI